MIIFYFSSLLFFGIFFKIDRLEFIELFKGKRELCYVKNFGDLSNEGEI